MSAVLKKKLSLPPPLVPPRPATQPPTPTPPLPPPRARAPQRQLVRNSGRRLRISTEGPVPNWEALALGLGDVRELRTHAELRDLLAILAPETSVPANASIAALQDMALAELTRLTPQLVNRNADRLLAHVPVVQRAQVQRRLRETLHARIERYGEEAKRVLAITRRAIVEFQQRLAANAQPPPSQAEHADIARCISDLKKLEQEFVNVLGEA